MPAPMQFSFKDRTTGAPVATAIIPEGYLVNATITDKNALSGPEYLIELKFQGYVGAAGL